MTTGQNVNRKKCDTDKMSHAQNVTRTKYHQDKITQDKITARQNVTG